MSLTINDLILLRKLQRHMMEHNLACATFSLISLPRDSAVPVANHFIVTEHCEFLKSLSYYPESDHPVIYLRQKGRKIRPRREEKKKWTKKKDHPLREMGYVNSFILGAPEKSEVPWKSLTLRTTFNDTVKYLCPLPPLCKVMRGKGGNCYLF